MCSKKKLYNIMYNKSVSTTPHIFRTKEIPDMYNILFCTLVWFIFGYGPFYYFLYKNKSYDNDVDDLPHVCIIHVLKFFLHVCLLIFPCCNKWKRWSWSVFSNSAIMKQCSIVIITSPCTDTTKPLPPPPPT